MAGNGTQGSPFEVATLADLQKVGSGDDGWDLDCHYIQVADIDASETEEWNDGEGFVPIGDSDNPFAGEYDGQGYKIDGLYMNRPSESNQSLFGASKGNLENICLLNVNITSGQIAGTLVGDVLEGTISKCRTAGSVSSGASNIGGICGRSGLFGDCPIENCYSEVTVRGKSWVGGLVGRNIDSVIKCYSIGPVSGNSVKGLVGFNQGSVSSSFYDIDTSGQSDTGAGEPKTTAEMMDIDTYLDADWDIVEIGDFNPANPTTWFIDDGNDYPRLWYEYDAPSLVPIVKTTSHTNINPLTTKLQGELYAIGQATSVDVYFQYRKEGTSVWSTTTKQTLTEEGNFTDTLANLIPDTLYEYQSVVEWDNGSETGYDAIEEFTTLAIVEPSVVTLLPTKVRKSSATLNGEVDEIGNLYSPVNAYFQYRAKGAVDWVSTTKQTVTEEGEFEEVITNLTPETEYEYRAVVEWDDGNGVDYGAVEDFTTLVDLVLKPALLSVSISEFGKVKAEWYVGADERELEV